MEDSQYPRYIVLPLAVPLERLGAETAGLLNAAAFHREATSLTPTRGLQKVPQSQIRFRLL